MITKMFQSLALFVLFLRTAFSQNLNLDQISFFAWMADLVYFAPEKILEKLPDVQVFETKEHSIRWFFWRDWEKDTGYISVRGSVNLPNWLVNLQFVHEDGGGYQVHSGFLKAARSVMDSLHANIEDTYRFNPPAKTVLVGHSLGGAICVLLGKWLEEKNWVRPEVISFGQPRITDAKSLPFFKGVNLLRVVNRGDLVPKVPLKRMNFRHFGKTVQISPTGFEYDITTQEEGAQDSRQAMEFWEEVKKQSLGAKSEYSRFIQNHSMNRYVEVLQFLLQNRSCTEN